MCKGDTIIDFCPCGGTVGGKIVVQSIPQEIAANKVSLTEQSLQTAVSLR